MNTVICRLNNVVGRNTRRTTLFTLLGLFRACAITMTRCCNYCLIDSSPDFLMYMGYFQPPPPRSYSTNIDELHASCELWPVTCVWNSNNATSGGSNSSAYIVNATPISTAKGRRFVELDHMRLRIGTSSNRHEQDASCRQQESILKLATRFVLQETVINMLTEYDER